MQQWLSDPYAAKAVQSLVLALAVWVLVRIALSVSEKRGKRTSEAPFIIKYAALFFLGIALVFIWLEGVGPVLTALTIVAAALTIVSKELILNFMGSFVIFWRELFAIGDRVQVGASSGDVIDKGLFFFTLLETGQTGLSGHSTGRLIKVPNALVLTLPVINATRGAGYVWNEVGLAVSADSDWEAAKKLLLDAVAAYYADEHVDLVRIKEVFEKKRVFFKKLTPRVYMDVTTGGFLLTLRYLCRSRLTRESRDAIVTRFVRDMEAAGVRLAETQPGSASPS